MITQFSIGFYAIFSDFFLSNPPQIFSLKFKWGDTARHRKISNLLFSFGYGKINIINSIYAYPNTCFYYFNIKKASENCVTSTKYHFLHKTSRCLNTYERMCKSLYRIFIEFASFFLSFHSDNVFCKYLSR